MIFAFIRRTCVILCLTVFSASAFAQGIGINFGADYHPLAPTDQPGVVPGGNWNNIHNASGTNVPLGDNSGNATTALLTFNSTGEYGLFAATNTPNAATNALYSGGVYGDNTVREVTISITNIPYSTYDVYVYASQGTDYLNTLSTMDGTTTFYYRSAGAGNDAATSLLETTSQDPANPTAGPAQYQVFRGKTGSTFTVTTGGAINAVLSTNVFGIQIVPTTPVVSALTLQPTALSRMGTGVGNVTLSSAPAADAVITLSSSDPAAASVPATMTIPAGQTFGTFTITAHGVRVDTNVTVSATYNGVTKSAPLLVSSMRLLGLTLNPNSVFNGQSSTGDVTLSAAAPAGGVVVNLATADSSVAQVPITVTVPAGATHVTFPITTSTVFAMTSNGITASFGGASITRNLTVMAYTVKSLIVHPSSVTGGTSTTGTVTLKTVAPAGGVVVAITSSLPGTANVPATVTVPAGSTTADFTITTAAVSAAKVATITATIGASAKSDLLKVTK